MSITVLSGKNQAHLQVATCKHGSFLAMLDSHINVPVLVTQLELLSTWCRIKKYEIRVPAVISALHLVSNLRLYTPRKVDDTCLELSSSLRPSSDSMSSCTARKSTAQLSVTCNRAVLIARSKNLHQIQQCAEGV